MRLRRSPVASSTDIRMRLAAARRHREVLDFGRRKYERCRQSSTEAPTALHQPCSAWSGTASTCPERRADPWDARTDIFRPVWVVGDGGGRLPFDGSTSSEWWLQCAAKKRSAVARHSRDATAELERIVSKACARLVTRYHPGCAHRRTA